MISVPRGKGLGGSTLINGMIYVRGQPGDYEAWEAGGASGWGYRDVAPYFSKLENYPSGGATRGRAGPVHLSQVRERFPISDAFLQAAQQDGQVFNDDYNSPSQEGFGYYQVNQKDGRRWSAYDAYLKPARSRSNLVVETGAHVLRLELQGKRCTGVTYLQGGREVTVGAGIEVVLTAGAIQTPQILELSASAARTSWRPWGFPCGTPCRAWVKTTSTTSPRE